MKKLVLLALIATMSMTACADKNVRVSYHELPEAAQELIQKVYVTTSSVSFVIMEVDNFSKEYKVHMNDQSKLKFDRNGKLRKAESYSSNDPLPAALIPEAINKYIAANYGPKSFVVEYECDSRYIDIELNSGIDLEFDKEGNFLRIED